MCTITLAEKSLLNIQVTYRFVVQPARSPLSIIRWFPSRSPGGLLEKAGVGDWEERESMLPVGVSSTGELWLSAGKDREDSTSQKDTKRISWAKEAALVTISCTNYKKKPYCPTFTGYSGEQAVSLSIYPKGTTAQFPPSLSPGYLLNTTYSWSTFQHVLYVDEMLDFGELFFN